MNWVVEFLIMIALLQHLSMDGFWSAVFIALFFIWKIVGFLFLASIKGILGGIQNTIKTSVRNDGGGVTVNMK